VATPPKDLVGVNEERNDGELFEGSFVRLEGVTLGSAWNEVVVEGADLTLEKAGRRGVVVVEVST